MMHHFRGKLMDGAETRLDPANVYILYHHASAIETGLGWNGYLLVEPDAGLEPGEVFRLTLTDGRSGDLRIDHVSPDEDGKLRAVFVGEGPLG